MDNIRLKVVSGDETETISELLFNKGLRCDITDIEREIAFKENLEYSFRISIDKQVYREPKLFIGDTLVKLMEEENYFYTDTRRYFLNIYELSQLKLRLIDNQEDKEIFYYTKFIVIMIRKMSSNFINKMLNELEKVSNLVLDTLFSKSRIPLGIQSEGVYTTRIEHYLEKTESLINTYKERTLDFRKNPHIRVLQHNKLLNYKEVRQIDTEGFSWLLNNPDVMKKVLCETGIEFDGEFYIPSKAMSVISYNNTDTYENRAILNMLLNVIKVTAQLKQALMNIDQNENVVINVQVPSNYEIPINSFNEAKKIYYRLMIKRSEKLVDEARSLFNIYKSILKCKEVPMFSAFKYTSAFSAKPHYRDLADKLISWQRNSSYSLEGTSYIFKLKSITEIYEYFCLIRIIKGLNVLKYTVKDSRRIQYKANNTNTLFNYYELKKEGSRIGIKVYYTPKIKQDVSEDSPLKLYTNSDSHSKEPDFVIEFFNEITGESFYGVFDAKYAWYGLVKSKYIEEIVLKYSHELSTPQSHFMPNLFTFILHPGFGYNENKKIIVVNEGRGKTKKPLPSIGYINLDTELKNEHLAEFFSEQIYQFEAILKNNIVLY